MGERQALLSTGRSVGRSGRAPAIASSSDFLPALARLRSSIDREHVNHQQAYSLVIVALEREGLWSLGYTRERNSLIWTTLLYSFDATFTSLFLFLPARSFFPYISSLLLRS